MDNGEVLEPNIEPSVNLESRQETKPKKMTRRRFLGLFAAGVVSGFVAEKALESQENLPIIAKPKIATTFSEREMRSFDIDYKIGFEKVLDMGFDTIRLGSYWEEIEEEKGIYNMEALLWMLQRCQERGQKVVLTLGLKAPRYPEHYWPNHLTNKTYEGAKGELFAYIKAVIDATAQFDCIERFQVENEPLDPSHNGANEGKDTAFPFEFFKEEVEYIREIDPRKRPLQFNLWGNQILLRDAFDNFKKIAKPGDRIGLDLYFDIPTKFFDSTIGPIGTMQMIKDKVANMPPGVELEITELQAEPWSGKDEKLKPGHFTMNVGKLLRNWRKAKMLNVTEVNLWGVEWAVYLAMKGYPDMLNAYKGIIQERRDFVKV